MKFSFKFVVDSANKLLICEACGDADDIIDIEHMFKTMVKLAAKNNVKNIVLDAIQFKILCSNVEISELMSTIQHKAWLEDFKIAGVVKFERNVQNVIEGLAEKLSLSIKNFETRSEAMLWLLFDKDRDDR